MVWLCKHIKDILNSSCSSTVLNQWFFFFLNYYYYCFLFVVFLQQNRPKSKHSIICRCWKPSPILLITATLCSVADICAHLQAAVWNVYLCTCWNAHFEAVWAVVGKSWILKIQHHILGNLCKCTGETRFSTGNSRRRRKVGTQRGRPKRRFMDGVKEQRLS